MKNLRNPDEFDPTSDEATDAAIDNILRIARKRLARALAPIRRPVARIGVIESRLGRLLAAESLRGLVALTYLDSHDGKTTITLQWMALNPTGVGAHDLRGRIQGHRNLRSTRRLEMGLPHEPGAP